MYILCQDNAPKLPLITVAVAHSTISNFRKLFTFFNGFQAVLIEYYEIITQLVYFIEATRNVKNRWNFKKIILKIYISKIQL